MTSPADYRLPFVEPQHTPVPPDAADLAAHELVEAERKARIGLIRCAKDETELEVRMRYAITKGDVRGFVDALDLAEAANTALVRIERGWAIKDVQPPTPLTQLRDTAHTHGLEI
jgi:hypothetical protein